MNKNVSWDKKFNGDQLIFLGSGGGRYLAKTQHRSTGGIIFQCFNGKIQCHIDPGPGAIRDINKYKIDPMDTEYIILTHMHTDHFMSIPIIIEASQPDHKYQTSSGTLIAPHDFLRYLEPYYKKILERIIEVKLNQRYVLETDFKINRVTPTQHGEVENYGYIFEVGRKTEDYHYTIGFTSDTAPFPGYVDVYKGVDILVANVLRPDDHKCRGHMTVNEFIPLIQAIKPKVCILTHFGGYMDSPELGNHVPDQILKIQQAVGRQTKIIGAEDGLLVNFAKILREKETADKKGLKIA